MSQHEWPAEMSRASTQRRTMDVSAHSDRDHFDTVIVGAGQAGLATGYFLAHQGRDFVIIDGHERVGQSWRRRWDSLRLFTPAEYDGLPGMPMPGPADRFPVKDEMANYLEAYAARFAFPLRLGAPVERIARQDNGYVLSVDGGRLSAANVVVATGAFHHPRVPTFASALDPDIMQLHSEQYRNPGQLQQGPVLVVGAGNSGAEIALDLAARHRAYLSGRDTGHVPFSAGAHRLRWRIFSWLFNHVLTVDRWLGRMMKRRAVTQGTPLIRVRAADLTAAGIRRVPRTIGIQDGQPMLKDGRHVEVSNVIWCTGFRPDFTWIDLPVFGPDGHPVHYRGVVEGEPGLYFVGLPFLYSLGSSTIGGVGRDAEYIARCIAGLRPPRSEWPSSSPGVVHAG
jgi:putative flavoprotein involved in K+ transport